MKNILILLFFPLFLFSQRSGLLPAKCGEDVTLVAGTGLTLTTTDSGTVVIIDNGLIKSDTNDYKINNGVVGSVKVSDGLKEGWYIQHADRVGTYDKDGNIIWGTSEPVYQGPSLYPDGWTDTISPPITREIGSLVNEPITITDESLGAGNVYTTEPVHQITSFYPTTIWKKGWVDIIDESKGITSVSDSNMITTTSAHNIRPFYTTSRSANPHLNTLELKPGSDITNVGIVTVYSDWMVETGWKMLSKGRTDDCLNHDWLNASRDAGDYNTTRFQIGLAKGDMLQECRICLKCKRMETQLTFMGSGTNPFIWEVTQPIYQQLFEKKE